MITNGASSVWKWLTGVLAVIILGLIGAWGKDQVDTDNRQDVERRVIETRVSDIEKQIASQYAEINGKLSLILEQDKRRNKD